MSQDRIGQSVKIIGGMPEFVGQTGTIRGRELGLYRVRLDYPVEIPNVGLVGDDLWEGKYLRQIRTVRPIRFRTAYGRAGGGAM